MLLFPWLCLDHNEAGSRWACLIQSEPHFNYVYNLDQQTPAWPVCHQLATGSEPDLTIIWHHLFLGAWNFHCVVLKSLLAECRKIQDWGWGNMKWRRLHQNMFLKIILDTLHPVKQVLLMHSERFASNGFKIRLNLCCRARWLNNSGMLCWNIKKTAFQKTVQNVITPQCPLLKQKSTACIIFYVFLRFQTLKI